MARLKVTGERGAGKTYISALYAVDQARQVRSVLWTGATAEMAAQQFHLCKDLADAFMLDCAAPARNELHFASGGRIDFLSAADPKSRNLRGRRYDTVIADETPILDVSADRQLVTRLRVRTEEQ